MTSDTETLQNGSKLCLCIGSIKTHQNERFVQFAIASRHIRSKVTIYLFIIIFFFTFSGLLRITNLEDFFFFHFLFAFCNNMTAYSGVGISRHI
jgi:Trk-type K+ transport system membrane component